MAFNVSISSLCHHVILLMSVSQSDWRDFSLCARSPFSCSHQDCIHLPVLFGLLLLSGRFATLCSSFSCRLVVSADMLRIATDGVPTNNGSAHDNERAGLTHTLNFP